MTTRELIEAYDAELNAKTDEEVMFGPPGPAELALADHLGGHYVAHNGVLFWRNEHGGIWMDSVNTPDEFDAFLERLAKSVSFERWQELRAMPYEEYLLTPEWKAKRLEVLERDGHACRLCGSKKRLQCHHRTYKNLGHEPLDDLTTLCADCHQGFHDNGKLAR